MDVSDPQSENYGKHWTPSRVHDFFSPSEETIETVKEWLIAAGKSVAKHAFKLLSVT